MFRAENSQICFKNNESIMANEFMKNISFFFLNKFFSNYTTFLT